MQDRPDINSLLEAVQDFLIKEVMPAVKDSDSLSYKTLVSWNMLGVIGREVRLGEKSSVIELERLKKILSQEDVSVSSLSHSERLILSGRLNQMLSEKIRNEKISIENREIWNAVKQGLAEKLEITNPKFSSGDA